MTTNLTAYTPLETFLLFQSLATYGIEPAVFSRTSDFLKKNPHIRDAKSFDSGRLSPDALRELYLRLLKEEIRGAGQSAGASDPEGQNGELAKNPRKRKAPSPSLPTAKEAAQHAHLIPALVAKLYVRYRAHVTEDIREEERRYDRLQSELQQIEGGAWDDVQQQQEASNGRPPDGPGQSPAPLLPPPQAAHTHQPASSAGAVAPHAGASSPAAGRTAANPPAGASPNGKAAGLSRHLPSSVPPPGFGQLQQSPAQPLPPRFPPPQPLAAPEPGYSRSPPSVHHSPYAPNHSQSGVGPSSSPPFQNATPAGRSPSSPMVLPPPPGMPFPPPSLPAPPGSDGGAQPYRGPPLGSPPQFQSPSQRFPGSPGGALPGYPAQLSPQRPYYPPYAGSPSAYPPSQGQQQQQQQQSGYSPQQGGVILPPFQIALQDPGRVPQQAAPPGPSAPPPTLLAPPAAKRAPSKEAGRPPPSLPPFRDTTFWKPGLPVYDQPLDRSPPFSPLSDASPDLPSPPPPVKKPRAGPAKTPKRAPRATPAQVTPTKETPSREPEMPAPGADVRPKRGGRRPRRNQRAPSTASSVVTASVRGRTRSQSVVSHIESASVDNESVKESTVKPEVSTPAEMPEDAPVAEQAQMAAPRTAHRRGSQQPGPTTKRKRGARGASELSEPVDVPPSTPTTGRRPPVLAVRHFARMTNPIMNDITSHKHASLFGNPVKEKDAEGYKDIIRRPQDLKSIRAAITAGSKAVNSATASDTPQGSPGGSGGSAVLPATLDLVPPRGIVNSAQLERELMRMFANAVMFNSGEDGVVQDAREMFETVQLAVSNWRSAERTGAEAKGRRAEEESDELAAEEDGPAAAKRRRL